LISSARTGDVLAADGGGGVDVGNFCFTDDDEELGPFRSSISDALCGNVVLGVGAVCVGGATGDCFGFDFVLRGLLVGGVGGSGFFASVGVTGACGGCGAGVDGIGGVGVSGNCCGAASGSVLMIMPVGIDRDGDVNDVA